MSCANASPTNVPIVTASERRQPRRRLPRSRTRRRARTQPSAWPSASACATRGATGRPPQVAGLKRARARRPSSCAPRTGRPSARTAAARGPPAPVRGPRRYSARHQPRLRVGGARECASPSRLGCVKLSSGRASSPPTAKVLLSRRLCSRQRTLTARARATLGMDRRLRALHKISSSRAIALGPLVRAGATASSSHPQKESGGRGRSPPLTFGCMTGSAPRTRSTPSAALASPLRA
mmetsp:Transcript_17371/g.40265  ORF Transcript_17371/g.40265 Transcript_17371/m.40265 type:complete len:237 (+) Transcript_17371:878-1588(+)